MSADAAQQAAQRLRSALLDHGIRKVSIELMPGRPVPSGSRWLNTRFIGEMSHHTAGPASGLTPSLAVCKKGRPGIPGPLCNGYGGRDFVYRIITMGLANHPGKGGPLTVGPFQIPADSARPFLWGTEWEHPGTAQHPWTDEMREFTARANAGILEWLGQPVVHHVEHSTWTGRKIDRFGYSASSGQDEIRKFSSQAAQNDGRQAPRFPGRHFFRPGAVNEHVTQLGVQLVRLGFGKFYKVGPGPRWTESDQQAVAAFQRSRRELSMDADGFPGPLTWRLAHELPTPRP
ncbi:MAG TPA: peptidoglycan-binding protein [Jiangellaceae bacterium]|nr:peptidoglycan-binding protein [Jiangellaceae bacterium]